jgi:hypothetical protein
MQSFDAASTKMSPLVLSFSLAAVLIFGLLGLVISEIVIRYIPAEDLGWIIANLE